MLVMSAACVNKRIRGLIFGDDPLYKLTLTFTLHLTMLSYLGLFVCLSRSYIALKRQKVPP